MASEESDHWYIVQNGQQDGPHDLAAVREAIRLGLLSKEGLVWRPGLSGWQEARSIPGLFTPPPLTPPPLTPPHASFSSPAALSDKSAADLSTESRAAVSPVAAAATDKSGKVDAVEPWPRSRPAVTAYAPEGANFFARHWRGDYSLGVSYWLIGIGTSLAIYLAALTLAALVEGMPTLSSAAIAIILGLFALGLICTVAWQLVGVWRSASKHKSRGGRGFWAGLAMVAVIFGVIRLVVDLSGSFWPIIREHSHIALGDNRFGEHRFRLLRNGTELEFTGGINVGAAKEFEKMLDAAGQVRILHLDSVGGRLAEADRIADLVRSKGLTTYVAEHCVSACTHIFLAGRERWIGERGKLGFHQPSFTGLSRELVKPMIDNERRFLLSAGLPDEFVTKALSTPDTSMWYPSNTELASTRAITGVADSRRFATTGELSSINRVTELLGSIPAYTKLRSVDPAAFLALVAKFTEEYRSGATEADIMVGVRSALKKVAKPYMSRASNPAVLHMADVYIGYLDALRSMDAESCVALSDPKKGGTLKIDLSKRFPELFKREMAIYALVLEAATAADRVAPDWEKVRQIMAKVVAVFKNKSGLPTSLFGKAKLEREDYSGYCLLRLELLREVRRLPEPEAAELLRYYYSIP